ncbi:MAG: universal stress protein [Salinirussus sp.]
MEVLVPFDLTAASERALDHAVEAYGPRQDAAIRAISFGRSAEQAEYAATQAVEDATENAAAAIHTEFVDADRDRLDDTEYLVGRILDYADETGADVVVVGRHEQGRLESLISKNTADGLIEASRYPVTVVP